MRHAAVAPSSTSRSAPASPPVSSWTAARSAAAGEGRGTRPRPGAPRRKGVSLRAARLSGGLRLGWQDRPALPRAVGTRGECSSGRGAARHGRRSRGGLGGRGRVLGDKPGHVRPGARARARRTRRRPRPGGPDAPGAGASGTGPSTDLAATTRGAGLDARRRRRHARGRTAGGAGAGDQMPGALHGAAGCVSDGCPAQSPRERWPTSGFLASCRTRLAQTTA